MTRIAPVAHDPVDAFISSPAGEALLRQEVTTLAGATVRFDEPDVRLSADIKISFQRLYGPIPAMCGFGIKRYVKHLTARNSPEYVSNVVTWLAPLARNEASAVLRKSLEKRGFVGLEVYAAFEREVAKTVAKGRVVHYTSAFVRWYEFCVAVGQPGFDEDVAAELSELIFRDVMKGRAVLSEDPDEGPLTPVEFDALISRLNDVTSVMLATGDDVVNGLDLEEVALTWLFVCYGTNPKNLRYLDEGDIRSIPQPGGAPLFEISIPRIKKRLKGERLEFRTREIPPDVYRLLNRLRKRNRGRFPIRNDARGIARRCSGGTGPYRPW
ncbi:hypothetical protein [Sphingomonas sp.]|uniref:hypothetical protein n=1 Tax=Sphingomonas sp. TaxID=28214 RepID=UPI0035BC1AAB